MAQTTVSVTNFEGPLGLLLELVEQGRLEVTTIAVASVTGQYLERVAQMTHLDRDELAQFAELGARLVYIKSTALLPVAEDDDLSPQSELKQLNEELAEYRLMRQASELLKQRLGTGRRSYVRPLKAKRLESLPLPAIEMDVLASAFQNALKNAAPAPEKLVLRRDYDQAEIAASIRHKLQSGTLSLTQLIAACHDRLEIIVTFLAALELVRDGRMTVRQSSIFEEIYLEASGV